MESVGLALRVGLSLACVLGLIWLCSRGLLKGGGRRTGVANAVQVLSRQPLSQRSSVAVVRVGGRALVLGVTEQRVTLLHETELDAVIAPPAIVERRTTVEIGSTPAATERVGGGPLTGSALSLRTWSQALDVLRERTIRR